MSIDTKQALDRLEKKDECAEDSSCKIAIAGTPKVRRKIDLRNEPKVKPGEMLEDYKFKS